MCPDMLVFRVIWALNTITVISGYDDLSEKKEAAQFNTSLPVSSYLATNALDRNISTCMRTIMGTTSSDHFTWWHVDLGEIHSVYNIRIQFKDYKNVPPMRQNGRFAGFSLYVSNTTDRHSGYLCYKDGPELPPLDFSTNCITHGRYIIFYNERLGGKNYSSGYVIQSVFTELCEVTVKGCSSSGVYGKNCDKVCPENCQEHMCDIINGNCLGCTPGWLKARCDKACPAGYYGLQCESKCVGHCKDIMGCNHTSGLCDNGCDDGWTGSNCTKECPTKTYGPDCAYNCSGKCLNDTTCNKTTGKCDFGCDFGYTGDLCETGCSDGFYGKNCSYKCSEGCDNRNCDKRDGNCTSGCKSLYEGPKCDQKKCSPGTYGQDCLNNCSGHCVNDATCNRTTGSCDQGCQDGYIGKLCEKASTHTDEFNDNCNASFYIAGLSFLIFSIIALVSILLLFIRRYIKLVREMRTLPYTTMTTTSQQPRTDTNGGRQYQELRIAEHVYCNLSLRNS